MSTKNNVFNKLISRNKFCSGTLHSWVRERKKHLQILQWHNKLINRLFNHWELCFSSAGLKMSMSKLQWRLTLWRPHGFEDLQKKKHLNARGFAQEFLWSGML